jgi:DNA-binding YbaB/EbfC family protein
MPNLGEILSQASKMKDELKRIQESVAQKTVETSAGGGMVKVVANGRHQIVSLTLDPELVKMGDREMLQDLVRAAVNEALEKAQGLASEEMGKLIGGLGPLASLLKGFGA